jgi:hypothetical protein
VIDEVRVVIDGQEFDAETIGTNPSVAASAGKSQYVDNDGTNDAVWYLFDIDGDVTIDEDDEVEMSVVVDFNDTDDGARYGNGTMITATVSSAELGVWEAEGADDLEHSGPDQFSGSANGEDHLLVAEGIILPLDGVETSTDTQGDNDQTGIFTIDFEVTAVEGDFYITDDVFTTGDTATTGVYYKVDGPGTATTSGVLSSTGDEDTTDVFTVREGETETFTLTVTVDASATGQHRVTLTEVNYTDEDDGVSGVGLSYTPNPAQDFRTAYKNINAN